MNFDVPQAEKFWRAKIAEEIRQMIDVFPEVNAQGIYLFVRNGKNTND